MSMITKEISKGASTVYLGSEQREAMYTYTRTKVVPVSADKLRKNRVWTDEQLSEIGSAYDILRTRVLQEMGRNKWNTLAITSPGYGAGKTVTAINLAISVAREVKHSVLLVDLDLRNPSVFQHFALSQGVCLSEYLNGEIELENVFVNPQIERLVLLPTYRPVLRSSEILSSPRISALVEELKTRYPQRIVIFDLPPVLTGDDVLAFSPLVDAVLLTIEAGKTQEQELIESVGLLQEMNLLGTVLNKSREIVRRGR